MERGAEEVLGIKVLLVARIILPLHALVAHSDDETRVDVDDVTIDAQQQSTVDAGVVVAWQLVAIHAQLFVDDVRF